NLCGILIFAFGDFISLADNRVSQDSAPADQAATRAGLLLKIDAARNALDTQLSDLRRANTAHLHDDMVAQGAAKLLQLNTLYDQLVSGPAVSSEFSAAVATAISGSQSYAADIRAMVGAVSADTSAQILSLADYQQQTADWDRKVARTYIEEGAHIAYARDI